ncbi:DUF3899 domain-containing protein [Domibacillus sp. A3M-37]|uniref:DUF3899 domain-containing protein n=1 Tax=Domibacillus sp. A3M-37 TaxID=2962037 RepID=UPI0020B75D36|nr:DUF3899 domain-containing protein [Domibacillus sp. A3M-37]MCP3761641.1 DUF3899 domain-containing protein [Domibacillus sp. A3M-37]
MQKKIFLLFSFLFISSAGFSLLQSDSVRAMIDSLFMIGLLFLVAGVALFLLEKGFFNGVAYGFKRLRKSSNEGAYTAQFDDLDQTGELHEEYAARKPERWMKPLLLTGGSAVLFTLLLSYILSS